MYTAFSGPRLIAAGPADEVAAAAQVALAIGADRVVIFEDSTGRQLELDQRQPRPALAGITSVAAGESEPAASTGRGRPRLGVTAREVTLLPRHWEWLATQPGGASAALRRLVDGARRTHVDADDLRQKQQAIYGVMSVLAGDLPGFEAATRALYAQDAETFDSVIEKWPIEVSAYIRRQVGDSLGQPSSE